MEKKPPLGVSEEKRLMTYLKCYEENLDLREMNDNFNSYMKKNLTQVLPLNKAKITLS
jgi:hypothetical protein